MRSFRRKQKPSRLPWLAAPLLPAVAVFAVLSADGGRASRDVGEAGALRLTSSSNLDSLARSLTGLPEELEVISDSLALVMDRIITLPQMRPTEGWLSSRYANSRLHPVLGRGMPHRGIDVAAPTGTPIKAPGAGTVLRVERQGGYGLMVELDHGDGIITRYAHCSRAFVVAGEQVVRGQQIAAVGSSGLSTGPHLHYEIIFNGTAVDPLLFME
jgi:murein DD-endopeptidase MepM/ murein hydrolase activator NlpD